MKGLRDRRSDAPVCLQPLLYALILALSYLVMEARLSEAFLYQGF